LVWFLEIPLPRFIPKLIQDVVDVPDTVPLPDFVLDNKYRLVPHEKAKNPFTCGISGSTYTSLEAKDRAGWLARALHQELGFEVNQGKEWDKVIGIYALNTVRYSLPPPDLAHGAVLTMLRDN
jgi:hypothetical protein